MNVQNPHPLRYLKSTLFAAAGRGRGARGCRVATSVSNATLQGSALFLLTMVCRVLPLHSLPALSLACFPM